MKKNKTKLKNQLWLARKRLGLGQKHVAYLLKHKTPDQVLRYEKGYRIPGLKLLLQLEIILGMPPRVLYADFYEELRAEIKQKAESLNTVNPTYPSASAFCSHEELLRKPNLTQEERDQIRRHNVTMVNRFSDLPPLVPRA